MLHFIINIIIAWIVALAAPLLIRFVIIKRPLKPLTATVIAGVNFIALLILVTTITPPNTNMSLHSPTLWLCVTFLAARGILKSEKAKNRKVKKEGG